MSPGERDAPVEPIERFDPGSMHGELLEAEHLARYAWAGSLAPGKRVLDAGCGTGYGSDVLARAGAAEVVGVDLDRGVVETARQTYPGVTFAAADLRELPAELGDFDLVVCFEVLEHLDDPETAVDRLAAAVRPGGLLAVSSPNRATYAPGNPFHKHEFLPDELAGTLSARFEHVTLVRQQDWLASGLFGDEDFSRLDAVPVPLAKAVAGRPGRELYSIALAGNEPLPHVPPYVMLTHTADLKWWQELLGSVRDELDTTTRYARDLEDRLEQRVEELRAAHAAQAELQEALVSTQEALVAMQETRLWRLGTRYWTLRDRLLGRMRGKARLRRG